MSKFDDWFKQYDGNKLSDVATYFVKPILRDAFNAGVKIGAVAQTKTTRKPTKAETLEKELVG